MPSNDFLTFYTNYTNYLSCFDFRFYRELKGATVYYILRRKSEPEGRWYGPLTKQST